MSNKVLFGLENVYIAFLDEDTVEWEAPAPIPGAVNLTLSPEGDQAIFYADNISYYVTNTNNGYSGSIEFALVPDTVLADMLGWEIDANGMLVEVADGLPQTFALLFEVSGNEAKKRYCFYKCTASRPKVEHETSTDKTDPKTQPLDITISPLEVDDVLIVKSAIERTVANASVFDAWFTAVTEPTYAVS
jgi:phi13 family phage major tail protein